MVITGCGQHSTLVPLALFGDLSSVVNQFRKTELFLSLILLLQNRSKYAFIKLILRFLL